MKFPEKISIKKDIAKAKLISPDFYKYDEKCWWKLSYTLW